MDAPSRMWKHRIPHVLIYSRLLMGALLLLLSAYPVQQYKAIAITLIAAALLTDIFDGIIARHLKISTERLRRMDSAVDQIFWTLTIVATFIQCKDFFYDHYLSLTLLILLEMVTYGVCFLKFRKEVATHAIASKIWTLTLLALIIQITVTCHSSILFRVCFYIGVISRLEIIAILILLREWTHDVPSLYHAVLLRNGKTITRNKLFNG